MSTLELIRGGTTHPTRNLDMIVEVTTDLSAYQYLPLAIDIDGVLGPYAPSAATVMVGILQNAPDSEVAIIRYAGVSLAVLGDTVLKDDRLKIDAGTGKLVPWIEGTDGHTHNANNAEMESVLVRVTDILTGAGVAGLTSSGITARQWFRGGGAISEHTSSTSVTEDDGGDGWYEIATTAIQYVGQPHRLSIEAVNSNHLITPAEYAWTPRNWTGGPPIFASVALVVGVALEDGVNDDVKLIRLLPQLF